MEKATIQYHAVGGAIRDLLLGHPVRDIDFVFDAAEDEFIQRNPTARKVRSEPFSIYLLGGQEYTPLMQESFAHDMQRRDFTINALALSQEGILHAHPDALADLKNRIIRPVSPASLSDDPVRVFRAARFAASLPGFSVHEETLTQMRNVAAQGNLGNIAPEQVGREVVKACHCSAPGRFLRVLHQGGCLDPWFSEFKAADDIPAGPARYHDCSVLEHTARVMDAAAELAEAAGADTVDSSEKSMAVWMALCHDIGKTATLPALLPRHIGHEKSGKTAAETLGERLRLSRRHIRSGALGAFLHTKAEQYEKLRAGTKTDLLMCLHISQVLLPFFLLVCADENAVRRPKHEEWAKLMHLVQRDLDRILTVTLPPDWRNRGPASGAHLRELRCLALQSAAHSGERHFSAPA